MWEAGEAELRRGRAALDTEAARTAQLDLGIAAEAKSGADASEAERKEERKEDAEDASDESVLSDFGVHRTCFQGNGVLQERQSRPERECAECKESDATRPLPKPHSQSSMHAHFSNFALLEEGHESRAEKERQ